MVNRILNDFRWQERVRSRLGVAKSYLPDADIESPGIVDVAEANVISQLPDYAEYDGVKRTWLEAATVCECAILLCLSMDARLPARQQGPHYSEAVAANWSRKRRDLEIERDGYILRVLRLVDSADIPDMPHFSITNPRWR